MAELLATSNGDLRLLINNGVISRSLMEILGLNVGNYLVAQLFGDDVVGINCAAADVGIRSGVAAPRLFVFDTENAVINITGNTNLATERLDLSIDPESKGMRVLTLRSPLYVKGTFKHPDAGVKAGPLIARGGGGVGAVLTPAAALLALVSPSEGGEENQCGQILREMKGKVIRRAAAVRVAGSRDPGSLPPRPGERQQAALGRQQQEIAVRQRGHRRPKLPMRPSARGRPEANRRKAPCCSSSAGVTRRPR